MFTASGPSPGSSGRVKQSLPIRPYNRDALTISELELALAITVDTARTRFYKNGLSVVPNPSGIYSAVWPVLCYYSEIYNLTPVQSTSDSTFTVIWSIDDANGRQVRAGNPKRRIRRFASVVEAGRIRVDDLPGGSYTLKLQVREGAGGPAAERSRHFFVHQPLDSPDSLKPSIARSPGLRTADVYESMDEEDLDAHFRQAAYIAAPEEKKMFAGLDISGKRNFLRRFWQQRDTSPETSANEYRAAYNKQVIEAGIKFRSGKIDGWETDRGRVYILYGPPDEIERFPSNIGVRAYQIWHYHKIEGGIIFIFVDKRSFGDMSLVHSTKRNEIYDEQWERWLR